MDVSSGCGVLTAQYLSVKWSFLAMDVKFGEEDGGWFGIQRRLRQTLLFGRRHL
jgi:hypothetical protein